MFGSSTTLNEKLQLLGLLKSYWPILSCSPNCLATCQCLANYWCPATNALSYFPHGGHKEHNGVNQTSLGVHMQNLFFNYVIKNLSNSTKGCLRKNIKQEISMRDFLAPSKPSEMFLYAK